MLIKTVEFARASGAWNQLPDDGLPEVAFVGRSNVGKSSLVNALVGRRAIARVSRTPGKTQAYTYYRVEAAEEAAVSAGGDAPAAPPVLRQFYLADLPGYGYAKVAQTQRAAWERLFARYLAERPTLRAVFQLVDARHDPTALDLALMGHLRASGHPFVLVLTKGDKLSKNQQRSREATLRRQLDADGLEPPVVLTSAEKKEGLDAVWDWAGAFLPPADDAP